MPLFRQDSLVDMETRRQFEYDGGFYRRVLEESHRTFIDDLDPVALLDEFKLKRFFTHSIDRDIRELKSTSAMSREILARVSLKGIHGYQQFKTCLAQSNQKHLVDRLNETENVLLEKLERETAVRQREQMANQAQVKTAYLQPQQTENRGVMTEKELLRMSAFIGMNWEMLGPFLQVSSVQIDAIKLDYPTTRMQIYKMFLKWSEYYASAATKQKLYSDLKRAPNIVNIDWSSIESLEFWDNLDSNQRVSLAQGPTNTTSTHPGDVLPDIQAETSSSRAQTHAVSPAGKLNLASVPGELPNQSQSVVQRDGETPYSETIHSSLFPAAFGNVRKIGPDERDFQAIDQPPNFNVPDGQASSRQQTTSTPSTINTSQQQDAAYDSVDAVRNDEVLNVNLPGQPALSYTKTLGKDSLQDIGMQRDITLHQGTPSHNIDSSIKLLEEGIMGLKFSRGAQSIPIVQQSQTNLVGAPKRASTSTSQSNGTSGNADQNIPIDEQDSTIDTKKVKEELAVNRGPPIPALPECAHDGRLLIPSLETVKNIIANSIKPEIDKGGFGRVYFYKEKIAGLGIPVVVKEIDCKDGQKHKVMSITNEKLASRTMHFAIVPLLAMTEDEGNRKFYFLTPFLENGDLNDAIKMDTEMIDKVKMDDIKLSTYIRVRILYQINSALQHLHTAVSGYRGPIIHMDVKSLNIVLDGNWNARLIDFGLARELNETDTSLHVTATEATGTKGYYPTLSYRRLTKAEDYHNFGIVIRELLTGKPAYDDDDSGAELRKIDSENIYSDIQRIWYKQMEPSKAASTLNDLSDGCIDKTMDSKAVGEILEGLIETMCQDRWARRATNSSEYDRCEICMVNPAVKLSNAVFGHADNCRCPIHVCVACMRNSFLNPIVCHSCSGKIIPCIGHGMGAILIAGNDEDEKLAQIFSQDIVNVHHVLVSKCPLVMGIREDYTQIVHPTKPGTNEDILQKVIDAFDHLKTKGDIHTLLIYFSGHHDPSNGFILGSAGEFLSVDKLKSKMQELMTSYSTGSRACGISERRFFVFLDCCASPDVMLPNLSDGTSLSIVQINSCRHTQKATANDADGSVFSKFFVQALIQRALGRRCINDGCNDCSNMKGEFITVEQLFSYITKHMQDYCKNHPQHAQPMKNEQHVSWNDLCIAYVVDFLVDLEFKVKGYPERETVAQQIYSDIRQLKIYLFGKLMAKMKPGHQFDVNQLMDFAESTCIEIDKGPRVTEELDSIEKVMAAWNARRELSVSLRTLLNISRGMVLVITPVGDISTYIKNRNPKMEDEAYLTRMILPYSSINEMVTDLKVLGRSVGGLKKHLVDIRQGINNAKNVEPDGKTEIHFLFPKAVQDHVSGNFMCFQLKHLKLKF